VGRRRERGLRLPYGERVGLAPIDRLNIVAHDRFQEIVDDAVAPGQCAIGAVSAVLCQGARGA
jgi:hypothetical protein